MILHVNFEELKALRAGAQAVLGRDREGASPILAPAESRARVEALLPMLTGDLEFGTLHEILGAEAAVRAIVECLRAEMESVVVATHAAGEEAVAAYFDFAHALTVSHRLAEMAGEMRAVIELVTGAPPTEETERTFRFPD
ncbi:MAG: hypothetical protein ACE5GJ_03440 [Gemmatimonadota bacterium]